MCLHPTLILVLPTVALHRQYMVDAGCKNIDALLKSATSRPDPMSVPIAFDALGWMAKSARHADVELKHQKNDLTKLLPLKAKRLLADLLECFASVFDNTATIAAQLVKMSILGHLLAFLTHGQAHTSTKSDFMPSCLSHDLQCNVTNSFVNAAQASKNTILHYCNMC